MDKNCFILREVEIDELAELVAQKLSVMLQNNTNTSFSILTTDDDTLIGTDEACKILGISPRTMQNYRDRKCISVIMRGPHKALYYRSEILAFRDANRTEAR